MSAILFGRSVSLLLHLACWSSCQAQLVPAIFSFGDSLADPGNNNYIPSLSKANFPHNGVDFPAGPTGRFTNGRTTVDLLGEFLGFKYYLPPYLAPSTKGSAILNGVNYASGSAGILNSSGYLFIGRNPMDLQLAQFANTSAEIKQILGVEAGEKLLSQALYWVNMGSNDFLDNYFAPFSPIGNLSSEQVNALVLGTYEQQLTRLYSMGARRFGVAAVGPLGCIPFELTYTLAVNGTCDQTVNTQIQSFNVGLEALVNQLSSQLSGAQFTFLDAYTIVDTIIQNPSDYGFTIVDIGCCGIGGEYRGALPCTPLATMCDERTNYVFWDPYHPTDKANIIIADRFYYGNTTFARPINVFELVTMQL
ncbi:unnamed protein product [Sphagnum jensenii]|uniref:GDSL esterase/lipase n=1 Tax=Sphagnum jensenii TaxID=128206 RepID=A0ABP0XEY9_9BRYO